jgi:hypothetical protein
LKMLSWWFLSFLPASTAYVPKYAPPPRRPSQWGQFCCLNPEAGSQPFTNWWLF